MIRLEQEGYIFEHRSVGGRLTNVVFSHPRALGLARHIGPDVIAMDSTFGTNKYCLPLINIVSKDPWGKNYYVAQAWMSTEDEPAYNWLFETLVSSKFLVCYSAADSGINYSTTAQGHQPRMIAVDRQRSTLNALTAVLPGVVQQICVWHSQKAVTSNAGRFLSREPGPPDASGKATPSEVDVFLSEWLAMLDAITEGAQKSIP